MINLRHELRTLIAINFFALLCMTGPDVCWANTATATDAGNTPAIADPELSKSFQFELIFNSDFSASPGTQPDPHLWRREDMGKTNNAGRHRHGVGRRHAAWYDRHHDKTAFVREGVLIQRGYIADKSLPGFVSRDAGGPRDHAYHDPDPRDAATGKINFADFELHTSWLDTFAFKAVKGKLVPVQPEDELLPHNKYWGQPGKTDTRSPNISFSPGTFFEIEVNFQGMQALAHRHSFWLMPAVGKYVAYDEDPANGLEIDIYEHELTLEPELAQSLEQSQTPNPNDVLLMKCLGGATAPHATENELVADHNTNINVPGINVGWHKIGLLWTNEELVWFVDGEARVRDTQLVPQVEMFLILSREANTGALRTNGNNPQNLLVDGNKIPSDPGLWGRNVATLGNRELIKAGKDEVKVRSVRAWEVTQ